MRTHEVLVIYKQKTASGLDDQLNDGREFELFKGYHCHRKRLSAHFSFIHFKFRNIASIKNNKLIFYAIHRLSEANAFLNLLDTGRKFECT